VYVCVFVCGAQVKYWSVCSTSSVMSDCGTAFLQLVELLLCLPLTYHRQHYAASTGPSHDRPSHDQCGPRDGPALAPWWASTGPVMGQHWPRYWPVLVRHAANTGRFIDRFSSNYWDSRLESAWSVSAQCSHHKCHDSVVFMSWLSYL